MTGDEIAAIKMGDDLGMALCVCIYILYYIYYTICIYIYTHFIFYCPYLSLVTIAVVMSMIDFHGHRTKPWHSQVAARLGTKASTFSALELWDAALVQLRWKTWIPYKEPSLKLVRNSTDIKPTMMAIYALYSSIFSGLIPR